MTAETELDNLLDMQSATNLYDAVVGMLYDIASVEPDDTVSDVVCKFAEWLNNRSDVLSNELNRIYEGLLKNLSRLEQDGEE